MQGGAYVEVFSAQGRDPAAQWKLTGSVKKEFDKEVRGNVYALEGGTSTTTTKMTLPKLDKSSCNYCLFICLCSCLPSHSESSATLLRLSIKGA